MNEFKLTLTAEQRNKLHKTVEETIFEFCKNEIAVADAEVKKMKREAQSERIAKIDEITKWHTEILESFEKEKEEWYKNRTFRCSDKTDEELLEYVVSKFSVHEFLEAQRKHWAKVAGEIIRKAIKKEMENDEEV